MFHALVNLRIGVILQDILVYYNDKCVYEDKIEIRDIIGTLGRLHKEYDLQYVEVIGAAHYIESISKKIENKLDIPVERINRGNRKV